MKPPSEIRAAVSALQSVDARLLELDERVLGLEADLRSVTAERELVRQVWRSTVDALRDALAPTAVPLALPVLPPPPPPLPAVVVHAVWTRPPCAPLDEPKVVQPKLPEPNPSRAATVRAWVLQALTERNRPMALAELYQAVADATDHEVSRQLWELKERGQAQMVRRGFYAVASCRRDDAA